MFLECELTVWLCVLQGTDFCICNFLRREHKPNFWKKTPPLPTRLGTNPVWLLWRGLFLLLLWNVFISNWASHWEPPVLLWRARAASLPLTPAGKDLIHSKHPNEIFLFSLCAGWAIFHLKMSGLELESDLSWACTHSTQGGEAEIPISPSCEHNTPPCYTPECSEQITSSRKLGFLPPTSTAGSPFLCLKYFVSNTWNHYLPLEQPLPWQRNVLYLLLWVDKHGSLKLVQYREQHIDCLFY